MKVTNNFQYELLADTEQALALYYKAASPPLALFPNRITVVLDPLGDWILEYTDVSPKGHAENVLQDLTAILGTP